MSKQSVTAPNTKWTVEVYKKTKKLSPVKIWDRYLHLWHNQYHGGCWHYTVPEDMVEAAIEQGARRLTSPFACENL